MHQVRSVLINVEALLCPSGCCRYKVLKDTFYLTTLKHLRPELLGPHAATYVQSNWPTGLPKFRIVGLWSEEERSLIHGTYGFSSVEEDEEPVKKESNDKQAVSDDE